MNSLPELPRIRKSARLGKAKIAALAADMRKHYEAGASIADIMEMTGRSYGSVHRTLTISGVRFRIPCKTKGRRRTSVSSSGQTSRLFPVMATSNTVQLGDLVTRGGIRSQIIDLRRIPSGGRDLWLETGEKIRLGAHEILPVLRSVPVMRRVDS